MKKALEHFIFYCILTLAFLYIGTAPLRNSTLRRGIILVGTFMMLALVILNLTEGTRKKTVWTMVFLLCLLAVDTAMTAEGNYLNILYSSSGFLALVLMISNGIRMKLTPRVEKSIFIFAILGAFAIILGSFTSGAYIFEDGRHNGALALGMTNTNLTGMVIFLVYSLLLIFYTKDPKKKYLLPLMAVMFYFIYLTKARSCLVVATIVTVYAAFLNRHKIPDVFVWLAVLTPIATVPIYLRLYHTSLRTARFLGKGLFSGREITFTEFLGYLKTPWNWLFGNIGKVCFANAHNAPLSVLVSIGIIGLVVVYLVYFNRLMKLNRLADDKESKIAMACILGVFIQSSAEAMLLSGYFISLVLMYILLMIAGKNEFKNKKKLA